MSGHQIRQRLVAAVAEESVCHLVCRQAGIDNPSAQYVANSVAENESVPAISLDCAQVDRVDRANGAGALQTSPEQDKVNSSFGLDAELNSALLAMEASFHVRLIGTFAPDLIWAPVDAEATRWLADNGPDYDQFPVRRGDAAVGVLLRQGDHRGKRVMEAMQPLSDGLIVSSHMPIADLIPELGEGHYRLILRGSRIDGLVTQSDLLKLPVRMLLFGLISHLEICLRALVRERAPWPTWLELLKPHRRETVIARLAGLKNMRLEPDPLEFTDFSDVLHVLARQPDLAGGFEAEAETIRKLRNDIAHSKTYITSPADIRRFVDQFAFVRAWIDSVSQMLKR